LHQHSSMSGKINRVHLCFFLSLIHD
jgi:hypothetical protein